MGDRTMIKMPKSILKKTSNPLNDLSTVTVQTREERNRSIAIHHAKLIQAQKDKEFEILSSIETFLDYPLSNPASPQDIRSFKTLLLPFQPTDYDELLLERRAAGKCAYVLCPNPSPTSTSSSSRGTNGGGAGRYGIVRNRSKRGADAITIVERSEMGKWCSEDCARKALYVRVQLSEEPAWTRAGGTGPEITLLEEKEENKASLDSDRIPDDVHQHEPDRTFDLPVRPKQVSRHEEAPREAMAQLSFERGDKEQSFRPTRVLETNIHERRDIGQVKAPKARPGDDYAGHGAIEGYNPLLQVVANPKV